MTNLSDQVNQLVEIGRREHLHVAADFLETFLKKREVMDKNHAKRRKQVEIKTGVKTGLKLEQYNGTYSLAEQRENNGKMWPQWAKYKKNKDEYMDKDWPIKVTLGDTQTSEIVLLTLLQEITGKKYVEQDVPF